jgi:hypothetical protein
MEDAQNTRRILKLRRGDRSLEYFKNWETKKQKGIKNKNGIRKLEGDEGKVRPKNKGSETMKYLWEDTIAREENMKRSRS